MNAELTVVVEVVNGPDYRKEIVGEFYARAAKLTLDGWDWQDALIHVGRDYGLFSNEGT